MSVYMYCIISMVYEIETQHCNYYLYTVYNNNIKTNLKPLCVVFSLFEKKNINKRKEIFSNQAAPSNWMRMREREMERVTRVRH